MQEQHYMLNEPYVDQPIHLKEADIVLIALYSMKDELKDSHVSLYIDNISVVHAINNYGAKNVKLSRVVFNLMSFAHKYNIKLHCTWIPTKKQEADGLSRLKTVKEAKLTPE